MHRFATVAATISLIGLPLVARPDEGLVERFAKMSCAVVHIHAPSDLGTGFFVDDKGTLVTAAHVITKRHCADTPNGGECVPNATLSAPISILFSDGHSEQLPEITLNDEDKKIAQYDLIRLATGVKSPCYIALSKLTKTPSTGQTLLAIGFPGFAPAPVLYSGFVSADKLDDPAQGSSRCPRLIKI
jgi:hypothetical protein